MSPLLQIILGLTGLWLGTSWIINGSLGLAKRYSLSHSFVGIAILAVGTDLPEVFVSVDAALLHLQGVESSGIITGNAIGSSISQITLILGVASLFLNFSMPRKQFQRDGTALLASVVLLLVFGMDGMVTRLEGFLMLAAYIMYYLILLRQQKNADGDHGRIRDRSLPVLIVFLISGFVVLILASHLVVGSSMLLARKWGVEQSFVGILIIGMGTSLPELAVSVGSAIRKSPGLSVGNIIGSNIFDGLVPVGIGSAISTINMETGLLRFDLPVLLAATILVLFFLRTRRGISRIEGITMIVLFLMYVYAKFLLDF